MPTDAHVEFAAVVPAIHRYPFIGVAGQGRVADHTLDLSVGKG